MRASLALHAGLLLVALLDGAEAQAGVYNGGVTGHQHVGVGVGGCGVGGAASGGGNVVNSPLVTENDQSVTTSVETVSTTGVTGYTTYTITLWLAPSALNCYPIYGDSRPLQFPPAYQVPSPFGNNVGGVSPQMYLVNPLSQFDSWLTVGETAGNTAQKVASIGINFDSWTESVGLVSAGDSGGAVFWMNPDEATGSVSGARTQVIAQLTLRNVGQVSQVVHFDAQGRSTGHSFAQGPTGQVQGSPDWEENCIEVMVGGPQNGQGSHSVTAMNGGGQPTRNLGPNAPCVMLTNPQGGVYNYNNLQMTPGTRATMTCMHGYVPTNPAGSPASQGDMVKTCNGGQWLGGLGTCSVATPCRPIMPAPYGGAYTYSSASYAPGSYATLNCRAGYQATLPSNRVKACTNGNWMDQGGAFSICQPQAHTGQTGMTNTNSCRDKLNSQHKQSIPINSCFALPPNAVGGGQMRTSAQCGSMGGACEWHPAANPRSDCSYCMPKTNPGVQSGAKAPAGSSTAAADDDSSSAGRLKRGFVGESRLRCLIRSVAQARSLWSSSSSWRWLRRRCSS